MSGIDYGMGRTNIDTATGIRYGVISVNSVGDRLFDAQEFIYTPNNDEDVYDDDTEPIGWHVKDADYEMINCLDNDAMVLKSPYYTYAPFCSPCVPGAGNLDDAARKGNLDEHSGVRTYCLGPEWFDGDKAPYPVYRVSDDTLVEAA